MTGGAVDELLGGLTGVNHEAVGELHGLGTGGTELARDDDLATLGARLHDEAQDTVAGTTDGQAVEELVAEGLALGDGGQTAVLDLGGVEGDAVLGELESLLDEGGELADAATLLAEDLLSVGGADDDVGNSGGNADFDTRVSLLGQLALEELVQLGVEDTVGDELSPLGAVNTMLSVKSSRIRSLGNAVGETYIWAPGTAILTRLFFDRLIVKRLMAIWEGGCRLGRFQGSCRRWPFDVGRSGSQSVNQSRERA